MNPASGAAGSRGSGAPGASEPGMSPAGRNRELDREPGGAGGSGRESEHEQAAGPKPKTPDVDLGM